MDAPPGPRGHPRLRLGALERVLPGRARRGADRARRRARRHYRFGEQQLNVHGPGQDPSPVAARPALPGGADLCFVWGGADRGGGPPSGRPRRGGGGRAGGALRRARPGHEHLLPRPRRQPPRASCRTREAACAHRRGLRGGDSGRGRGDPLPHAPLDPHRPSSTIPPTWPRPALIALNLPPRSRAWHAGFMAGALLPDVDHVPLALAPEHPGPEHPRPDTHCLGGGASALRDRTRGRAATPRRGRLGEPWPTWPATSPSGPACPC